MIEASNLSVAIGRKRIIENVDFQARPGELTAIVGPNGSGKTTLLRALSGDLPFTGRASINAKPFETLKPWQMASLRAVLPQATTLAFPYTVREIVRLGLTSGYSGAGSHDIETLPDRALALVDLEGFAGRFYQELSGGEQQRVQLARVLCQIWEPVLNGEPRYLFLDEPVSSLDIKHQLIIMRIAKSFSERGGGVIAILHDLNLTAMFADKVVMVHRGKVDGAGNAGDMLCDERILRVYECALKVGVSPAGGAPFVLPQSAA
ncbi:hemin import ATP-binding protein HmuV [Brucella endophytica]|uniref:Hemin import ATP-binding protein HmuV n=1 Tax=Brucella endophytica TaxID=1963359 RepID=A0A916WC39_9HYPH|nr:heme ABC transporter ATP-binding protein [Brucella endophytica]GGA85157.1 hemin import ATP-binding protein HmuV [Brucella endophytica]